MCCGFCFAPYSCLCAILICHCLQPGVCIHTLGLGNRLRRLLKHPENEPNPEVILNICHLPEVHYDAVLAKEDEGSEVIGPKRKVAKKPSGSGSGYMGYDLSNRKPGEGHGKKFYSLKKDLGLE